ncbi:MAG: YbeD family protein [Gammaproteobacteria bacterium]
MSKLNGNGGANGSGEDPQGLVYPCDFPLKMFGMNTLHFIAAVDSVVEQFVPREDWASTKTTPSKNDKYVSYTIVIVARDRDQLDKVCAAVTNCPEVIMAL